MSEFTMGTGLLIPFETDHQAKVKARVLAWPAPTARPGVKNPTPSLRPRLVQNPSAKARPSRPQERRPGAGRTNPGELVQFAPRAGARGQDGQPNGPRRVLDFTPRPKGRLDRAYAWCQRFDTTGVWGPEPMNPSK